MCWKQVKWKSVIIQGLLYIKIMMARQLGQGISKPAGLVGLSCCAVVSSYQKPTKSGHVTGS